MGWGTDAGLNLIELEVLKMIQELYGRRMHRPRDCYVTEDGEICIFIKDKKGDSVFSANLTVLSRIRQAIDSEFKEQHFIKRLNAA